MVALAVQQPGGLGAERVRGADEVGITVSYGATLEAVAAWNAQVEHQVAQARRRGEWYAGYARRVARVERAYTFACVAPAVAGAGPGLLERGGRTAG